MATHQASVSVVIPAHNGARFIEQALESVFAQTIQVHDVWVIDNASADGTCDVVAAFPQVNYVRTEIANVGAARQLGVERSKGKLIAFLDQDDLWSPHKTEQQLALFENDVSLDAAIGQQCMFLEPGTAKPHWLKENFIGATLPGYLPSALMVRREAFEATGGFNHSYMMTSDVAWFFKVEQLGLNLGIVDAVVVKKRIHADNDSKNINFSQSELMRVIKQSLLMRRQVHAKSA